ncbi:hypothetical protein FACS1894187_02550 [Synergistales bacterium]|nr:hypothetical protein FACS1894187_02550 [Synergistales bacterium]
MEQDNLYELSENLNKRYKNALTIPGDSTTVVTFLMNEAKEALGGHSVDHLVDEKNGVDFYHIYSAETDGLPKKEPTILFDNIDKKFLVGLPMTLNVKQEYSHEQKVIAETLNEQLYDFIKNKNRHTPDDIKEFVCGLLSDANETLNGTGSECRLSGAKDKENGVDYLGIELKDGDPEETIIYDGINEQFLVVSYAQIEENQQNAYEYSGEKEKNKKNKEQCDLAYGHLDNGLSVWNRLQEEAGDYKKVAHINPDRTVKFYDENLPNNLKKEILHEARTCDMQVSTTQKDKVFHTKPLASAEEELEIFLDLCAIGTPKQIEAAIDVGADPNAKTTNGWTPLMAAAWNNLDPEVTATLLTHGAEVNTRDNDGLTALLCTAENNAESEVIKVLLDAGADVNVKDNNGVTPLIRAVKNDSNSEDFNQKTISLLLGAGADPNAQANDGTTSLIMAARLNAYPQSSKIVKTLISHGADVNVKDYGGWTPLIYASGSPGNPKMVKTLLDAGADVNAQDNNGRTAIDRAKHFPGGKSSEIISYLESASRSGITR